MNPLKKRIEEAVKNDGTLRVRVVASFEVDYAAHAIDEMNNDVLAELLHNSEMLAPENFPLMIDSFTIVDARND